MSGSDGVQWPWWRPAMGLVLWGGACLVLQPEPLEASWGYVLLMFAPLVLVPIGLRLCAPLAWPGRAAQLGLFVGGLMLCSSFNGLGRYINPGLLALPWLIVTALISLEGLLRLRRRGLLPLHETCIDAGLVFLLVGGLWTAAARAGMRPMGFDDTVVLLTANHFHYAGFVLPIAAGLAGRAMPGRFASMTALAVIAGVPLTAIGITSTHLGGPKLLEAIAALVMAMSGIGVAWMHLRLAARPGPIAPRIFWAVAGVSLLFGMALAALYGVRFCTRSDYWLTIPWMRFIHGTVNAFGFATAALAGWWLSVACKGWADRPTPTTIDLFPDDDSVRSPI